MSSIQDAAHLQQLSPVINVELTLCYFISQTTGSWPEDQKVSFGQSFPLDPSGKHSYPLNSDAYLSFHRFLIKIRSKTNFCKIYFLFSILSALSAHMDVYHIHFLGFLRPAAGSRTPGYVLIEGCMRSCGCRKQTLIFFKWASTLNSWVTFAAF